MKPTGAAIQIENGNWYQLHNHISEAIAQIRISATEHAILHFLLRQTYGYRRTAATISYGEFEQYLPYGRRGIMKALDHLVECNIVRCAKNGDREAHTWSFNKYHEQWIVDGEPFNPILNIPKLGGDEPQFTTPSEPQFTTPSEPQFTTPSEPQFTTPSEPQFTTPSEPQFTILKNNIKTGKDKEKKSEREHAREGQPATPQPAPPSLSPKPSSGKVHPLKPARGKATDAFYDPRKLVAGQIPEGTGSTAVEVHREFFDWSDPQQGLSKFNCRVVTDEVKDLALWRDVCRAWASRGHKGCNREGLMDWYNGNGNNKHSGKEHRNAASGSQNTLRPTNGWTPADAYVHPMELTPEEWAELESFEHRT